MKHVYLKTFIPIIAIFSILLGCQKTEEDLTLSPNAGNSFLNIESEGYFVSMNAQAAPEGQNGEWRIYSGLNGRFEDVNNPNSDFFGEPGEIYLLGWELSAGDKYKAETINVSFAPLSPKSDMVLSDTVFNSISLHLNAETPKYGSTGIWEIIEGDGGRIGNPENSNAEFIGAENSDYTLRWSLMYGSKVESIEYTFQTDTLRAFAGVDRLDIITSKNEKKFTNLDAFLPAGATGTWELLGGYEGEVYNVDDPSTMLGGIADSTYTLAWKVKVDNFESTDTLKIRFRGKWGMFTDERDGKTYRFVEVNGLRWMVDNFDYNAPFTEYGRSWYYGQSNRAQLRDGHPVETDEERKFYGRLYNWFAAVESAPPGWKLPSKFDFADLIAHLGGEYYAHNKVIVGGELGLEINFPGSSTYSNGSAANRDFYGGQEMYGAYWTDYANYNRWESSVTIFYASGSIGAAPFNMYFSGATVRYVQPID
jgi:uncharacterized protein (TIGR02145 family)